MEHHRTKEDFSQFTSNIYYYDFDKELGNCNNISYFSDIKDELQRNYLDHNISDKIEKALCFIYNKKKEKKDNFDSELCSYLYYWIGAKIYPEIKTKSLFSKIITMLYHLLDSTDIHNTCKPLHNNIDEEKFNKYKLLFDYSKDHEYIYLKTLHGHTTCDEDYKMVIEKYINAYRDVYSNCMGHNEKNYDCDNFKSLFKKKTHSNLTSITCKQVKTETLLENNKGGLSPEAHFSPTVSSAEGSSGRVPHRKEGMLTPPDYYYTRINSDLAGYKELDGIPPHPTEESAKSGSTKTIMGSVVPVLGVSSFSLLLYKVTPVGGYINRLLGRNRNMYNHIEYMDTFNPYDEGMDPVGRTMNISYHRL
ncbi:Plasmodium vivax Vir protein, putative [Plasmodium vivax]|uniref:Vir protein, putative n=1 Tax=Plasmodium vivax TaxID=5855 RepID=A0A1G4EBB4_PLAVI|nr:Plasmodium vivax Vir protein, putative [Plasmodium vivax]